MKNRQLTIDEYKNFPYSHTIIINNVRFQKEFHSVVERLVKPFLTSQEIFMGFYRTDGINLTRKQQMELKEEIPAFFHKHGEIQNLGEHLSVAKIDSINLDYDFLPSIFDYYLETIVFNSKVDWETFKRYHSNYQQHRLDDIILNHFADILLCYCDSGDFLICFNPQIYNSSEIRSTIIETFF